jgi:hypothetical protein
MKQAAAEFNMEIKAFIYRPELEPQFIGTMSKAPEAQRTAPKVSITEKKSSTTNEKPAETKSKPQAEEETKTKDVQKAKPEPAKKEIVQQSF